MTEYERLRKEALLTDEEIKNAVVTYEKATGHFIEPGWIGKVLMQNLHATAQAQLDKALETDGIEIRVENMPKIICLCGSTRFTAEMLVRQWELMKQGYVVLSWCALPDWYFEGEDKTHIGDQEGVKKIVDEVHFRKIDLSDEILVINIGGYIGDSTKSEIRYALGHSKPVKFLEPEWAYPDTVIPKESIKEE